MRNIINKIEQNNEFMNLIKDIISNNDVKKMKQFRQHYNISCYEHCFVASYYTYLICKKLKLNYKSASRAAMVHDLFLYDWRIKQPDKKGLHGFTHPQYALDNASQIFELSDLEKDIILTHMWPLTFFKFPKYKESFVLSVVDKYCALSESFYGLLHKQKIIL